MYPSKLSGLCTFLGLASVLSTDDRLQTDENLLFKFYRYKGELEWMWSGRSFCRVLCPRGMGVAERMTSVRKKEFVLETPGCAKLEAEMLECLCESRRPGRSALYAFRFDHHVNGWNGEVYRLRRARGVCGERKTLVIGDRIIDVENASRPSKLRGISHIFETRSAIRADWRQWNEDRVSGRLSDSSNESGESRRLQLDELQIINPDELLNYYSDEYGNDDERNESSGDDDDDDSWISLRELRRAMSTTTTTTTRQDTVDDDGGSIINNINNDEITDSDEDDFLPHLYNS